MEKLPKNDPRIAFITEALKKLERDLKAVGAKLVVFKGKPEEILPKIVKEYGITDLYTNKSHSSYGKERDQKVREFCFDNWISFHEYEDTFLVPEEKIPPKKIFSAFYRIWNLENKEKPLSAPEHIPMPHYFPLNTLSDILTRIDRKNTLPWHTEDFYSVFQQDFSRYPETRDFPALEHGVTKLSPYLRFGLISIRQVFHYFKAQNYDTEILEKELAWREFWNHIAYYFPETLKTEFQEKRRHITWHKDEAVLNAWKEGKTGYPIVDAAMKQLRQEGWMHNRARMIVASFLTKDLLLDWRLGEQHFAELLLDYDEAINIGNWQWSASVGADPRPMRIFSPIRQSENFDPDAQYIKKYLPELKDVPAELLHDPITNKLPYISPIVDHSKVIAETKRMYFGQ